jgi:hypothetical protein
VTAFLLMLLAVLTGWSSEPRDQPATSVPYDGGRLVADVRWFEGTVGLHFLRHGREVDAWCSSGAPIRSGDLVAWVTLVCPESGDIGATVLHRARVDGSHRVDQGLPRRPDTSGSVTLLRFRGADLVYRSIDGELWRTDLVAPPRRLPGR